MIEYLIIGQIIMLSFLMRKQFCESMMAADVERGATAKPWHVYAAFAIAVATWPLILALGLAWAVISSVNAD